jgi:tetratricopeptide (TPR) repeat protein
MTEARDQHCGQGHSKDAAELREQGNVLFKDQRYEEAAVFYRQALAMHPDIEGDAGRDSLGQVLRLNLATCLLKLSTDLEEAISLCDDVLATDPENTKAVFRRGSLRFLLFQTQAVGSQRELLQNARKDVLQAARGAPGDRHIRELLDTITEEIRKLRESHNGAQGFGGLYEDQSPAHASAPLVRRPVEVDLACCGKGVWITQRAQWLGMPEEIVGMEPSDFENDGTLCEAILRKRGDQARLSDNEDVLSELSDEERDNLECCIESTSRPFPELKRKLPLVVAVRCAEEIWAEGD